MTRRVTHRRHQVRFFGLQMSIRLIFLPQPNVRVLVTILHRAAAL